LHLAVHNANIVLPADRDPVVESFALLMMATRTGALALFVLLAIVVATEGEPTAHKQARA
jgi:hypothetical protein